RHVADEGTGGAPACADVQPVDGDRAAAAEDPQDAADERRLAGAVAPPEGERAARAEVEGDIVHGGDASETLGDVASGDHARALVRVRGVMFSRESQNAAPPEAARSAAPSASMGVGGVVSARAPNPRWGATVSGAGSTSFGSGRTSGSMRA